MNCDSVMPTLTEMSSVWTGYLNGSMSKYTLAYFCIGDSHGNKRN